jgi:hypothetical protein
MGMLCLRILKKKVEQPLGCSIEKQARAPAPHFHFHEAFQDKPAVHFARGSIESLFRKYVLGK